MTDTSREISVAMIHPQTWENDHEIFTITDPIPVDMWLEKATVPGREVEMLPYDSLIAGGPYDGGHVIALHMDDDSFLFAVPPEAILLLEGLLPDDQYRTLLARTPKLAALAAR